MGRHKERPVFFINGANTRGLLPEEIEAFYVKVDEIRTRRTTPATRPVDNYGHRKLTKRLSIP